MNLDIAERLAQMRRRRGLSQGELARALGLSRQAVSKWERGESSPDTENLVALADFYGVSLDELVRPGCSAEAKPAADREPTLVEPGQPDDSASADPLAPRSPRRWTRRAAIGLGVAAAFAAGAFLGSGAVPYPGGQLDLKSGIKRLLGYPEIRGRDFNTVGFRNVVLEWPAGTVEFVPTSSFFQLTVEESSCSCREKDACLVQDRGRHAASPGRRRARLGRPVGRARPDHLAADGRCERRARLRYGRLVVRHAHAQHEHGDVQPFAGCMDGDWRFILHQRRPRRIRIHPKNRPRARPRRRGALTSRWMRAPRMCVRARVRSSSRSTAATCSPRSRTARCARAKAFARRRR